MTARLVPRIFIFTATFSEQVQPYRYFRKALFHFLCNETGGFRV